jgi:phosphotriesterase-related protein
MSEKKVMTVCGPISPDDLGITMSHDHLLINASCYWREPEEGSKIPLAYAPVSIEILGALRRDAFLNRDNCICADIDDSIKDLMEYKMLGGKSIAEVTPIGLGRDPMGLRKISIATGVNVICGTGWYTAAGHPPYIKGKSVDELQKMMVKDLTESVDGTGIKAGLIGEIGQCCGRADIPFNEDEKKVLIAAARAQAETGVPMTVHPNVLDFHVHTLNVLERHHHVYLDTISKEGANLEKFYFSHMDFYCTDLDLQKSVLDRGVGASYDGFSEEEYFDYSIGPCLGQSNRQRIAALVELLKLGYEKQIMLSAEVAIKTHLKKYGGLGHAHVLEYIISDLKFFGVNDSQINCMLVENPKRYFAY